MQLFDWLNLEENAWILRVFLTVLGTGVFHFLLRSVLNRLHAHFKSTVNHWDEAFLFAAIKPLLWGVWVVGVSIAAGIIESHSPSDLFQYTGMVRRIVVILLLMLFLLTLFKNLEQNFRIHRAKQKLDVDEVTISVVGRLLRLSVIITGVLVILQTLGINIAGVVAFGGIGGIAVGFAAKDLLANFFGGLMVYMDRPFTVGDWIRSPDRDIEGTVEDIGWRLTRIRTFDKRPLYLPNATFTTIAVENPSRMQNRRIYETFGLRYADAGKVREIIAAVKEMLTGHAEIDTTKTLIVNFNSLSASSLDFFIYTFTRTTDWVYFHEVKQDVLLKVIDIIHAHDADIAFPTRTLEGALHLPAQQESPQQA